MIRQAVKDDLPAISALYEAVLDGAAAQGSHYLNWRRGVYPTAETARQAIEAGELYVGEDAQMLWGAVVVNGTQSPEYAQGAWTFPADTAEVGVLHTLCVHPEARGQGRAGELVRFGEALCRTQGRRVMRLDTWAGNIPGLRLYPSLGYTPIEQVEMRLAAEETARMQLFEKKL